MANEINCSFPLKKCTMKKIMFLASFCLLAIINQAQDTIYLVDGTQRQGKVVEVSSTQVRYFPAANLGGPIFHISLQLVAKIVYEDGTVASFQDVNKTSTEKALTTPEPRVATNALAIDAVSFFLSHISVSYEKFIKSSSWGIRIPVSIRFREFVPGEYYWMKDVSQEKFRIGVSGNNYFFDNYPSKFYFGPSISIGSEDALIRTGDGISDFRVETGVFVILAINAGYQFFASKNIFLGFHSGLLYRFSKDDYIEKPNFTMFEINVGFTF